jgi:hypothetical protein
LFRQELPLLQESNRAGSKEQEAKGKKQKENLGLATTIIRQ